MGYSNQKESELVVKFLTRLEELNVPLNWTDDLNLYESLCVSIYSSK